MTLQAELKNVLIIAETLQHIKNWARHYDLNLTQDQHIRWAQSREKVMGLRDGYFVVLTWPRNGEQIVNELKVHGFEDIGADVEAWPIDAFGRQVEV